MNTLIIGGTTGLGLQLGKKLRTSGDSVIITGRKPVDEGLEFKTFDLSAPELPQRVTDFVAGIPKIDRLIYSAGYYQEGRVTDLSEQEIEEMINVGGRGLIYFVQALLKKQGSLGELMTITSTSQWVPRQKEPIYTFVKAGAAHFSNSIAEDGRVEKVLVVGPSGMRTALWDEVDRDDLDEMLDPAWVADRILELEDEKYKYRFARILRQPGRVEIVETR
jgi:short-subunit dehydrogenase